MAEENKSNDRNANIEKIGEFIRDIDFTMMTTVDADGELQSRPMSTQKTDFDGDLYFFTFEDSAKIRHIRQNPRVNLAYSAPDRQTFLSLKGEAQILKDKQKMEELWEPTHLAWFPEGLETPGITLIKVRVKSAEYWDSSASAVAYVYALAKAAVTGQSADLGENETIEING